MTFLEHLDELRTRLIRSLLAVGVGIGVAFPFRKSLYNLLLVPQSLRVQTLLADGIAFFERLGFRFETMRLVEIYLRAISSTETHFVPNFRSPMEPFAALFKICIGTGLVLASPVVLYQAWAFVLPALKPSEKRFVLPLFVWVTIFFLGGVLFSFFVAAPLLLEMAANLWRSSEIAIKPENLWTFDEYIGFLMQLVLAFGVAFELPLVMGFVSRVGWVSPEKFRRNRRYAILILVVVSAVLTPGDIVPMTMMAGPLIVLYEVGILFASVAGRRRALREALTQTEEVADGA